MFLPNQASIPVADLSELQELEGAIAALNRAGVQPVLLQGVAYFCGCGTLKDQLTIGMDLWVQPGEIPTTCQALEEKGFQKGNLPTRPVGLFNDEDIARVRYVGKTRMALELHPHLTGLGWLPRIFPLGEKEIWSRSLPCQVGHSIARNLAPEDALISICLSLVNHHYNRPEEYRNIYHLVEQATFFPWQRFVELATRYRLRTVAYFALSTSAHSLGASIPGEVLAILRPSTFRRRLVRWIADPYQVFHQQSTGRHVREFLLPLAVAERPTDGIRMLTWLFFPGRAWLRVRYQLRGKLPVTLAYLWYPFFVLGKGLFSFKSNIFQK